MHWNYAKYIDRYDRKQKLRIEYSLIDNKENDGDDCKGNWIRKDIDIDIKKIRETIYLDIDKIGNYIFKMKTYTKSWSPYSDVKSITIKNFKLFDSGILKMKEAEILSEWMDQKLIKNTKNKSIRYRLLWRSSRDGERRDTFHSLCDNRGATLTIFHSEYNHVFGGYTKVPWTKGRFNKEKSRSTVDYCYDGEYKKDDDVFVYLLRSQFNHDPKVYPIQKGHNTGVYHCLWWGPSFGDDAVDYQPGTICCKPEGQAFKNWKGNILCGGQTYDESKKKYECKLKEWKYSK